MSHSSRFSIRSLQCPYNADRGVLALGQNYSYNTNLALYHHNSSPNALNAHPSGLGTSFYPGNTADTNAAHSPGLQYQQPPSPEVQYFHVLPYSVQFLLGGMSGDAISRAPSKDTTKELKDSSSTSFSHDPPKLSPIIPAEAPTYLDFKGSLLPKVSPHVREAISPTGRRQWYCAFPHCARSPFFRRDRAEIHVASVHLNEKRIYCNGSCGTAGW